ncbi:MAG: hypothetical protein JXR63_11905 [Spirochaetales bacterium]|nr:hypothetical protein [Spirochaetales bacterium]
MRKKLNLFLLMILALFLFSCASLNKELRDYDEVSHKSAVEEFAPHRDVTEWWYLTGYLNDESGNLFFYQFTIFHGFMGDVEGFSVHLGFTDIATGQHIFEETITFRSWNIFAKEREVRFRGNYLRLLNDNEMELIVDSRSLKMNFKLVFEKLPVWHGNNGIIVMGHEDKPTETSFYYSVTSISSVGSLSYRNPTGSWVDLSVTGKSWFDRQWGQFTETKWDWFSLRFFDGREIMLFNFPTTFYREGTIIDAEGSSSAVESYDFKVVDTIVDKDLEFPVEWELYIPGYETLYIRALAKKTINRNVTGPDYWEGLCGLYDGDGLLLGYCVTETTF